MVVVVVVVVLIEFMSCSCASRFDVGGVDGWVQNPSETYTHWAMRNRFQISDTLVFKYKRGEDSVLVVDEKDCDACNINNPIEKMDNGYSTYNLSRSGPFFFISGVAGKCQKGQKLVIVVLAPRIKMTGSPASAPSPLPSPVSSPSLLPSPLSPDSATSSSSVLSFSGTSKVVVMVVMTFMLVVF
ncbi:Cupredoxins domain-containing protein [Dioscorea alata]|uniref:Cupredoxins domain-containing protein n=1 Tax=Dioscorea alata TaxID=55571 RepID=A0ACB7UBQ0_DIOAL|nr:Cupredoxins domain-containing protein [Dioscorea alata]